VSVIDTIIKSAWTFS